MHTPSSELSSQHRSQYQARPCTDYIAATCLAVWELHFDFLCRRSIVKLRHPPFTSVGKRTPSRLRDDAKRPLRRPAPTVFAGSNVGIFDSDTPEGLELRWFEQ